MRAHGIISGVWKRAFIIMRIHKRTRRGTRGQGNETI
jgi:hypothetical protein